MQETELSGAAAQPAEEAGSRGATAAALLGLLAVLCLVLGDALFTPRVLTQADALGQFEPWRSEVAADYAPSNPLLLDQATVMQPWLHFGAERVRAGTPPLWNPDNYLGQPMVGTYQSAYFWPLHWTYFAWPSWQWYEWSALLRLFVAGLFTWLFLRRLGLRPVAAATGAVGFALSGFMVAWLGHMHTHVAMFLPAFFWQVERIARRPTLRNDGIFGLLVGGALLAGHLQTAVHLALGVGAWVLFRTLFEVRGTRLTLRGLAQVAAGAVLGVLLAMPQLLPFFEYLGASQAAGIFESTEQVAEFRARDAAVLLVDPGHFGTPAPAHLDGAPYSGPSGANLNYNELIGGYVGLGLLALALCGLVLRRGRVVWFFLALATLAALVAWQVSPFYDLARAVPRLRSTKMLRLVVLTAFALATLGAVGLDALLARLRGRAATAAGLLAFALVSAELVHFARGYNPIVERAAVASATPVTDLLAAAPRPYRALPVDGQILPPSANLFYGVSMLTGYDSVELREVTELIALMSSDPGGALFVREIDWFDRAPRLGDLLGVRWLLSTVELPAPYELALDGACRVYANPGALPRAFAATDTLLLEDRAARLAHLGSDALDPWVAVLEREPVEAAALGLDLAAPGQGAVELVAYEDLRVELACDLDAPGLVVVADAWESGWVAQVDGVPATIERVDHALRGVVVPAGAHRLVMRYEPPALYVGGALGVIGLLGLLGLLFVRDREQEPGPKPPSLW